MSKRRTEKTTYFKSIFVHCIGTLVLVAAIFYFSHPKEEDGTLSVEELKSFNKNCREHVLREKYAELENLLNEVKPKLKKDSSALQTHLYFTGLLNYYYYHNLTSAEYYLKKVLKKNPRMGTALVHLAKIKKQTWNIMESKKYYLMATSSSPTGETNLIQNLKIQPEHFSVDSFLKLPKWNQQAYLHFILMHLLVTPWKSEGLHKSIIREVFDGSIIYSDLPVSHHLMNLMADTDFDLNKLYRFSKIKYGQKEYSDEVVVATDNASEILKIRRIRVAYWFPGFYGGNPLTYILSSLLKFHDPDKFTVICLHDDRWLKENYGTKFKNLYESLCGGLVSIKGTSDRERASQISGLGIDILIDLAVFVADYRPENILRYKPAKKILTWLSWPSSTHIKYIDYAVVDQKLVPRTRVKSWSETVCFMPDSAFIGNHKEEFPNMLSEDVYISKSSHDMQCKHYGGKFVFINQSYLYKFKMCTIETFCHILKQTSNSVLVLLGALEQSVDEIIEQFSKLGCGPDMVFFEPKVSKSLYMKRIQCADLYLDTPYFNGGSTLLDVLWTGIPVVSMTGEHFINRMALSMLSTFEKAGCPGFDLMLTNSMEGYVYSSLKLYSNTTLLHQLRTCLRSYRMSSPLYDQERWIRNWENILAKIVTKI